jgi:hypothetical protein
MWIWRRRLELFLLAFSAIPLIVGLHLPPPVARTYVVSGPIQGLEMAGDQRSVEFAIQGKRLTSNWLEPGYQALRSQVRNGVHAKAVGWSWLGAKDVILELDLDGRPVVLSSGRLAVSWAFSLGFSTLAAFLIWIATVSFRSNETAWERYKRGRRILNKVN